MSCFLRFFDFDPTVCPVKPGWRVDGLRKGEPNRKGVPNEHSVFQVEISKAAFDDLPGSVADAIQFLTGDREAVAAIAQLPGVEEGVLDFGVAQHQLLAYHRKFPAALVRLAGHAGVGIEISLYAVSGVGGFVEMPDEGTD